LSQNKKILVLGAASWLGSIFLNKTKSNGFQDAVGTYYKTYIAFDEPIKIERARELSDYQSILKKETPDIIINFLRGENEEGFNIHQEIIKYCTRYQESQYVYTSSALALDAYMDKDLTENVLANAKSEYGKFKARCEKALYNADCNWTILRFSSLQGYCAHKIIRNEHFLSQLKKGEFIKVDQGVYQNRMLAEDAVDMMFKIIDQKKTGIIHLGTTDASDEIDFLKRQAQCFGYDENQIVPSGNKRNVKLNCIPKKIHAIHKEALNFTETYTLERISEIPAYQKYLNSYEI